jgi:hypothetical protein
MLLIHSDEVQQCLTGEDGEIIAITTQRPPHRCQRDGFTGLIQQPSPDGMIPVDATTTIMGRESRSIVKLPESLLVSVYGIDFAVIPYDYDPPLPIDPLPECSDEVTEYLLSFWESARKIALHPRIVDRLQRRAPWFDAEDMPQTALEYLLSDPARYALEDSHQGARQAVRDILDDLRRGNRTLIDGILTDRRQKPLNDSIPEPQREYSDPDDEVSRIMSLGVVSTRSAHIAIALASDSTREVVAESLGVGESRVYQLRRSIQAEILVYGTSLKSGFPR